MNLQCNGVATIDEQKTRQCCFLSKEEILYSKPGDYILYHLINATVKCKKGWSGTSCDACAPGWTRENCDSCSPGWTGDNCTECATNYGPPNLCDRCLTGWTGDNCDACTLGWTGDDCDTCADGWTGENCDQICDGFGCCNQDECQGCIQNGRWEGTLGFNRMEVHLTFRGETCSDLVPGNL